MITISIYHLLSTLFIVGLCSMLFGKPGFIGGLIGALLAAFVLKGSLIG